EPASDAAEGHCTHLRSISPPARKMNQIGGPPGFGRLISGCSVRILSKREGSSREQVPISREDTMAVRRTLNVNGRSRTITVDDPDMPLLYALRENLSLNGPLFGCGLAQCGACTVHVDGKAVRSCVHPLSQVSPAQKVVTIEGLAQGNRLHPV